MISLEFSGNFNKGGGRFRTFTDIRRTFTKGGGVKKNLQGYDFSYHQGQQENLENGRFLLSGMPPPVAWVASYEAVTLNYKKKRLVVFKVYKEHKCIINQRRVLM